MEALKKEQEEQKLQQVVQLGEEDLNQVTGGDKKVIVKTRGDRPQKEQPSYTQINKPRH